MSVAGFQSRLVLASLLLLLLGACSTIVYVPAQSGPIAPATNTVGGTAGASAVSLDDATAGYGRVLKRHVNDQGEVDFAALRDDTSDTGLGALEGYVQAIAVTSLDAAATPQARLAHMVNAYNAERDRYLLKPIQLASGQMWQPMAVAPDANGEIRIPLKWLKGKPRDAAMANRKAPEQVPTNPVTRGNSLGTVQETL